ncbi:MAG: thioether cross-link-forming SCIFF peptide maturase, partial [Clostridiales bacterium]
MIHQYKLNGYNIVLDINSGAVHVVDEVAYDIIAKYQTTSPQEITAQILDKYQDNPDITAAEIGECLDDIA